MTSAKRIGPLAGQEAFEVTLMMKKLYGSYLTEVSWTLLTATTGLSVESYP